MQVELAFTSGDDGEKMGKLQLLLLEFTHFLNAKVHFTPINKG